MTNSSLRFSATLDAYNKNLIISDTNTYTGDYQSVIIRVINTTLGVTMYENSGYDSNDFSHPDIVPNISASFIFPLTLDSAGNIICGDYSVEYKVREALTTTKDTVTVANPTSTSITIDFTGNVNADTDAQVVIDSGCAWLTDTGTAEFFVKIVTASYNSGTKILTITTDSSIDVDIVNADTANIVDTEDIYTTSNTFTYCYTKPTVGIEIVPTCSQSTLYSEDTTDYNADNYGTMYSPTTLTRTHTVQPPLGSSLSPTQNSSTKITILPNIWTGIWQSTVNSVIEYSIKKWSNTVQDYWFFISDIIEGYAEKDVQCKTCYCELASCTQKLYNDWIRTLATNPSKAAWYGEAMLKMTSLWMQYQQAVACGNNSDDICDQMAVILTDNDCHCDLITNEKSKEVIPVSEIYGAGSGSKIYFGTGVPNVALGGDEDTYINSTNMDVYYKENGAWGLKGTMKGSQGEPGEDGATWTSGSGVPSNGSGNDGDFYLRTTNGNVYKKTAGVWEVDAYLKGDDGAAATIDVGVTEEVYGLAAPTVTNTGTTSEAILKFQFPSESITIEEFKDSFIPPEHKFITGATDKSTDSMIKIVSIDTGTNTMVLNDIPADVANLQQGKKWVIFCKNYSRTTSDYGTGSSALIVEDVDLGTNTITYGSLAFNDDFTNIWKTNAEVIFYNPFANMEFVRTTPICRSGIVISTTGFTTGQVAPIGMTKKDGLYSYFCNWYKSGLAAADLRILVYRADSEENVDPTTPYRIISKADLTAAFAGSILPAGDSTSTTGINASGFIKQVSEGVVEMFTQFREFNTVPEPDTVSFYVYLYHMDAFGNISNVREYQLILANNATTSKVQNSYLSGCVYLDGEYIFSMLNWESNGSGEGEYTMAEYKINGAYIRRSDNNFFDLDYLDVASYSVATNVVTINTKQPHYMTNGEITFVKDVSSTINGYTGAVTVTGANSFTYAKTTGNESLTSVYTGFVKSTKDNSGHLHGNQSVCEYKGLTLIPTHPRQFLKNYGTGITIQGANLMYYDKSDKKIKLVNDMHESFFAPPNIKTEFLIGDPSADELYGLSLGFNHNGLWQLFWDKEEDILFVTAPHNDAATSSKYNACVMRVKFKS